MAQSNEVVVDEVEAVGQDLVEVEAHAQQRQLAKVWVQTAKEPDHRMGLARVVEILQESHA